VPAIERLRENFAPDVASGPDKRNSHFLPPRSNAASGLTDQKARRIVSPRVRGRISECGRKKSNEGEMTMSETKAFAAQASTLTEPRLDFVMEVRLWFARVQTIANMPTGASRGAVYVDRGEFAGPRLRGKAVPSSGGD
jgi:hypothetical protein